MFYILNIILSGCLCSVVADFLCDIKYSFFNSTVTWVAVFGFISQILSLFILCELGYSESVLTNISEMTVGFIFKYFVLSGFCAVVVSLMCPLLSCFKAMLVKKNG